MSNRKQPTAVEFVDITPIEAVGPGMTSSWEIRGTASANLEGEEVVVEVRPPGSRGFVRVTGAAVRDGGWHAQTEPLIGTYRTRFVGDATRSASSSTSLQFAEPDDEHDSHSV